MGYDEGPRAASYVRPWTYLSIIVFTLNIGMSHICRSFDLIFRNRSMFTHLV